MARCLSAVVGNSASFVRIALFHAFDFAYSATRVRGGSQLSTFMEAYREYARGEGVWDHRTLSPRKSTFIFNHVSNPDPPNFLHYTDYCIQQLSTLFRYIINTYTAGLYSNAGHRI